MENRRKHDKVIMLLNLVFMAFSFLASGYILKYMRLPEKGILWILISGILYYAIKQYKIYTKRVEAGIILLFSILFSITNVCGAHIVTNGNLYFGLLTENYILPFNYNDLFGTIILTYTSWIFFGYGYSKICAIENNIDTSEKYIRVDLKYCLLVSLFIFLSWIPYFLIYYPGFMFPDSLSSVYQALGAPLNNHHPIMYTLFIKVCLNVGMILKDITLGCAIYTIIQMSYIAFCLAYMICWMKHRGISSWICNIIMMSFGFMPFIAQNSIAMWKDPIFSATILLWSLHLFDYALSGRKVIDNDKHYIQKSCIIALIICFSRNNGFYVVLACECILLILLVTYRKTYQIVLRKLSISTGIVLLVTSFITGPVYSYAGVQTEPVESMGIFLNQMARVAAYDGEMSQQDREFMNNILPLEKYAETYRPCVVDRLKWDEDFNTDFLNTHLKDFVKVYISMLIKNPNLYLEAWVLNTFGYWVPNYWEFFDDEGNITKGNLSGFYDWDHKGIEPKNLLDNSSIDWRSIFSIRGRTIYLAIVNWLLLAVVFVVLINKKWKYLMVLAPSMGLVATLLIATPYAYWQRYGLAEYYLLPIYFFIFFAALKKEKREFNYD